MAVRPGDRHGGRLHRRDLYPARHSDRRPAGGDRAYRLVLGRRPSQAGLVRGAPMKSRPVLDVSQLPTIGFGPQAPLWWGVLGLFAIEGTMFALVIANYFYLRLNFKLWPPANFALPDLGPGTANLIILLASIWPMWL